MSRIWNKLIRIQTAIGSSNDGLNVANAIRANPTDVTDRQLCKDGVFLPGRTFIETVELNPHGIFHGRFEVMSDDLITMNLKNEAQGEQ